MIYKGTGGDGGGRRRFRGGVGRRTRARALSAPRPTVGRVELDRFTTPFVGGGGGDRRAVPPVTRRGSQGTLIVY